VTARAQLVIEVDEHGAVSAVSAIQRRGLAIPPLVGELVRTIAESLPRGRRAHCALCSMPAAGRCNFCRIAVCRKHGKALDEGYECLDCAKGAA